MASEAQDKRLTEALARFKVAAEAEQAQRQRELEDLKFVDLDEQWPEDVKAARSGYQPGGGVPAVPARPCLTINKLRQPVEQIANEARQARFAVNFAPRGDGASRDVAEVLEDIARAVQTDSRANLARIWAFERAVKCGRGYYRIVTEYSNDGDFDQDIVYKRIQNQASVYMDPATTEPDGSDAEWAFVVEDVPFDRYKRLFPDSELATSGAGDLDELTSVGDDPPGWVQNSDDGGKVVRIAEYFYVEHEKQTVKAWAFPDGAERALPDGDPALKDGQAQPVIDEATGQQLAREVSVRTVKWCKLNALEILEQQDWPGRYIPIVPVVATESNVNGERRWTGLVRPAMDAQRSYNYMRSAQVEAVGLAPRAPWVGYAETFEGYEAFWNQSNQRNFPYLPIKRVPDGHGGALPPPVRNVAEPAIQAITIATHEADGDIKATTRTFDASLGNMSPSERSGKAILALQKQAEQANGGYLDNLAQMSMVYEGKILRDLIPKVYSRPGRIIAAIGADEQRRSVMVGKPFIQQQGQPVPVPDGTHGAKFYDLTRGEYTVAVTIGKSQATRREEGAAAMGEIISAAPQLLGIVGDLYVENLDFPGARQMADRLKKTLPPQLQDNPDGQQLPPQVLQQMQQAQEMIDQLTAELNAKNELIERETVKSQADLDKARMDNDTRLAIAAKQSETQIQIEKLKLEAAQVQGQIEIQKANLAALQADNQQRMAQAHEAGIQAQSAQDARVLEADRAGYQQEAQAQGAEQQAALAEQQAALSPGEATE